MTDPSLPPMTQEDLDLRTRAEAVKEAWDQNSPRCIPAWHILDMQDRFIALAAQVAQAQSNEALIKHQLHQAMADYAQLGIHLARLCEVVWPGAKNDS